MTISVVTACYGDFRQFHGDWLMSLAGLNTQPDDVLVEDGAQMSSGYPQAHLLNRLVAHVGTEWFWHLGVDNVALPDALDGLDMDGADALLFGFSREDGAEYIPQAVANDEFLALRKNSYPSDSLFRTQAVRDAGGFPDIGHEDWGLWRRMCSLGMTIRSTGRIHWQQRIHNLSRTNGDIGLNRAAYLAEVLAA